MRLKWIRRSLVAGQADQLIGVRDHCEPQCSQNKLSHHRGDGLSDLCDTGIPQFHHKKANPFQCPQRPRLTSVTSPERWYAMRCDNIFRLIFLDPSPADRAENRAVVCRRKNLNFISSHVVSSVGVATSSSSSSSTRCRNVYLRNECKAFGRGFEIITTESSPQSS